MTKPQTTLHQATNDLLYLLFNEANPVGYSQINRELKLQNKETGFLNQSIREVKRLNLIDISLRQNNKEAYSLKIPVKNKIETLPAKFDKDPYGYFLDEETIRGESDSQKKWYDLENAKQVYADYPRIRKQSIWAFWISIISLFIAGATMIQRCNC